MWYLIFIALLVVCLVADCLSPLENDVGEFAVLPPLVAAAAIYAGSSIFSSLFNKFSSDASQKSAEERQFENQKELMKIQQDYNKENIGLQSDKQMENWNKMFGREMSANARLMATSPSIQRSAQQSAGISPNTAFGQFSGNVASPSSNVGLPSSPSGSAPLSQMTPSSLDLSGIGQLIQNAPVVEAQAKLTRAQAKAQELENKAVAEENAWYSAVDLSPDVPKREDDKFVLGGIDSNQLDDVVNLPSNTRKGAEARWLARQRIMTELSELDMKMSESDLKSAVADAKLSNSDVMEALERMDEAEFAQIEMAIDEAKSRIRLNNRTGQMYMSQKAIYDLEKEYNLNALVDRLSKSIKNFDFGEFFSTLVSIGIRKAIGK